MFNFQLIQKKSFGIDPGNTNTLVSDVEGLLIDHRSCFVVDDTRASVKAVGDEAYDMFEKTHAQLRQFRGLPFQ